MILIQLSALSGEIYSRLLSCLSQYCFWICQHHGKLLILVFAERHATLLMLDTIGMDKLFFSNDGDLPNRSVTVCAIEGVIKPNVCTLLLGRRFCNALSTQLANSACRNSLLPYYFADSTAVMFNDKRVSHLISCLYTVRTGNVRLSGKSPLFTSGV